MLVGRGGAGTEVRRARSYLRGQGRDCLHQSCAAVPSAYVALVAHAVILPGRSGVSDVDVFTVLFPLLFGWLPFSPLVGVSPCSSCLSLWSLFPVVLAASLVFFSWLSRWFRGRPGGLRCWSRPSSRPCGVTARRRDLRNVVLGICCL